VAVRVAILDVDGTLVDTNYQHALAWYRAFRAHEIVLPIWKIHRHIGMGGDQLVEALAGEEVEERLGDEIRSTETKRYGEMIGEVEPFAGARELICDLRNRGRDVVLASSAKQEEIEHYVEQLDARELAQWTSSADVESTKPAPDLVHAALDRASAEPGASVMLGDTPWDVRAADRAGVETIAVMTGGFSREELLEAGAVAVYESVEELRRGLDDTRLGGS
jgi:HAD superfamily hydrolase (TIGR01509 family)